MAATAKASLTSRLLIVSPHGAVCLPWKVVKTERPGHDFVIELFDLGLGPERHVERHLER